MSSVPSSLPPLAQQPAPQTPGSTAKVALLTATALAAVALVSSTLLWQKLSSIQEQLARQSGNATTQSIEARTMARQAQEQVADALARLAVAETRISDVTLQRGQLETLVQALSRSRDENMVVDIESAVRMAQQQAQLTGSLEPVLSTLQSVQQRLERVGLPHLAPVQRALEKDLERLRRTSVTDTAGLLGRLDDLVRQVDDLPVLNAVAQAASARRMNARPAAPGKAASAPDPEAPWWRQALQSSWEVVRDEARHLVRVSRIDQPEAVLLSPEQTFFLRENLKLKLLNARLGVLARQYAAARSDLAGATAALNKYFDPASRRTQSAATALQQVQGHLKDFELPRLEETLAALATAAASR